MLAEDSSTISLSYFQCFGPNSEVLAGPTTLSPYFVRYANATCGNNAAPPFAAWGNET